MKKLLVALLCLTLAAGAFAGCGKDQTGEENKTTEQTVKDEEDKDKEETNTDKDTEKEEEKGEEPQADGEKSEEEAPESETDMSEDLTMKVLKEQAGTIDYTSLDELKLEPGSQIAVVVKNKKSAYYSAVKKGMEAAVKDINEKMGYEGEDKLVMSFEGPTDETDVETQINILDAVLSENPQVLCLAAVDMESCEAQLETAAENDIPVVILDSGVESDLVNAVCSTDNYTAGMEAAKKLAAAMGEKGQAAVMTHAATAQSSQERERGFTEEIEKNHTGIEIVNISHENEDTPMEEMAEAVLKLYPELKGYYCTNEESANAVLSITEASDQEIQVVGFDAGKKQQEAVKNGTELGIIAQNPYGMGYATIVAGIRADLGLENDAFINTGFQWLDSTNLESEEYGNYLYQ